MSKGLIAALITVFVVAVVGVAWFAISEKAEQDAKTATELVWEENTTVMAGTGDNSASAEGDADATTTEEPVTIVEPATEPAATETPASPDTPATSDTPAAPAQEDAGHQAKNREPIGAETQTRTCPHCGSTGRAGDPYCQYCGSQF